MSKPVMRMEYGVESSLAKSWGVDWISCALPDLSTYAQVNTASGDGGGPSVRVSMRCISRIIFSFVAAVKAGGSFAMLRSMSASSLSLVVMRLLMTPEDLALKLSG